MMAEWICKKRFSVPDVVLGGIEINVGDRFADVEWNRHDHFNIPKIHTVFRWINPSCDPESDESDVPYFIGIHPDDVNKLLRRNNGEDVGKSIEKHYCTKCIHGILCESGELKCNHEAWTTTKDGTYAYPNGLRQIKSRDKPSWCPGFKAMQERVILKMSESKTVTYTDGMVAVESGAIDECPDVYPFPPSVDMENVLGLVDALGLNFNLGVAVQHIAYAEDSTSNDARIRNLCQARGYIEREIKAVSEK